MPIKILLNKQIKLYSGGQTIGAGGGVTVNPVLKVSDIKASIQPLSGMEVQAFAKSVIEGSHYFICLQKLAVENGDIIEDEDGTRYRITWYEMIDATVGKYFAMIGQIIRM